MKMTWMANSAITIKRKVQVKRKKSRDCRSHDKNMAWTRGGPNLVLIRKKSMSADRWSQCSHTSYWKEPRQIGNTKTSSIRTKTSNLQFLLLRVPLHNLVWNTQFNTCILKFKAIVSLGKPKDCHNINFFRNPYRTAIQAPQGEGLLNCTCPLKDFVIFSEVVNRAVVREVLHFQRGTNSWATCNSCRFFCPA